MLNDMLGNVPLMPAPDPIETKLALELAVHAGADGE
jgi:hypothetical protein